MKHAASKYEVAALTWDQVKERLQAGAVAILPIGAGAKEHGLHMPMATDQVFAEYFSRALAERIDALIWPTLTYGFYPAFTAYAGSVSLSRKPFAVVVKEIVDDLLGFGASRVLVLDTGLSTIAPVEAAIGASRDPSLVRHLKVFAGPRFEETVRALQQQSYGSHADEMETSLMLAIAPELVDMTRAEACLFRASEPARGPLSPDDPSAANYSPSGSFGDPTLASREKGLPLLAAILADMVEAASEPKQTGRADE
ncbi:MAG TPA: creatininase family protein [Methyloceanibacter sp.]|nr:creatininase family protein [Methyloceanibacter sp.]